MSDTARLAVDIGGTFTDVALDRGGCLFTRKVLTTAQAPEEGVMAGIRSVLPEVDRERRPRLDRDYGVHPPPTSKNLCNPAGAPEEGQLITPTSNELMPVMEAG